MNFEEISRIDDDMERNRELYKFFDEEKRLATKAGQVEKITTLREIKKLINKKSKILDVGAGTGVYTLAIADEVSEVYAIEPSENNYRQLVDKLKLGKIENVRHKNVSSLEMQQLPDQSFDLVLLFGPLYHLSKKADRDFSLEEAKRLVKNDGHILVSFINHDMVPMTELSYDLSFFERNSYIEENQRLVDRPFIFFTLDECLEMLKERGLKVEKKIGTDGFSELLADRINSLTDTSYKCYLDWHLSHSQKEEFLGASSHFLFVCKK